MASETTNTLVDFRIAKIHQAENGSQGSGKNMTGKSGSDLEIIVPVGTTISDLDTKEEIGDLKEVGERIKVALMVMVKLPSGFQRDLQKIKAPLFKAIDNSVESVDIMSYVI